MWFRLLLLGFNLASWWVVFRMLGHKSLEPAVLGRYSSGYVVLMALTLSGACCLTLAHRGVVYTRLFALRRQMLLSLIVTLVLGVGVLEIAFRAFDLFGVSFYEEVTRCMKDFQSDPVLAFRHRYNFRTKYGGVDVSFNEIGLRERPLAAGFGRAKRILVLGDSVTFGWAVPAELTYPRQMEKDLQTGFGIQARTINSGVCGYNTIQEYEFLKRWGDRLQPDLISLLFVDNDVQPVEPIRPERTVALWSDGPSSAFERVLRWSWVYRIGYHLIPFAISRPVTVVDRGPDWQASMKALSGIAGYCRQRRIPLTVFLYRMQPEARTDAIRSDIARLAASENFVFTDVLSWFAGKNVRQYVNSVVDAHPNAAGHAILARGMADVIGLGVWSARPSVLQISGELPPRGN